MHPDASFYDGLEQQARLDRQQEEDIAFQARYESERQDRAVIRQELERGVPEAEIEEHLELASDFVRLNPGQDVRAYVRRLMEEEQGAFHAVSEASEPFRDGLPRATKSNSEERPAQAPSAPPPSPERPPHEMAGPSNKAASWPAPAPNQKTAEAEAMARDYVNGAFKPDDWLAVVAVNRETGETVQRVSQARNIVSPDYQRWLRYLNATGSDVYVSLNTLKEHARGRTKEDLKEIRHLYLDLDDGGDPAATDSTRVFRLPGFNNKKYPEDFRVEASREGTVAEIYRGEDFKIYAYDRERAGRVPGSPDQERALSREQYTQSERDWQYAIRKLKAGEDPNRIIQEMAAYRSKDRYDKKDQTKLVAPAKVRPYYYAEQTVTKAMASLGMTKQPARTAKATASSRETETAPSR